MQVEEPRVAVPLALGLGNSVGITVLRVGGGVHVQHTSGGRHHVGVTAAVPIRVEPELRSEAVARDPLPHEPDELLRVGEVTRHLLHDGEPSSEDVLASRSTHIAFSGTQPPLNGRH